MPQFLCNSTPIIFEDSALSKYVIISVLYSDVFSDNLVLVKILFEGFVHNKTGVKSL